MAFPTILVNSATGTSNASGATASGAGPSTAITGATATTANNGSAVTARRLELSGSPDLTNVATDGSHVIYFHDTTAGRRRYVAIEGKGGSGTAGAYVDVAVAMGGGANGVTAAYAIGGVLNSAFGANHELLFNNNSSAGDAMPGWTMQLASGHTETFDGVVFKRSGDTTSGPITLTAESGYAVRPVLTNNSTNISFDFRSIQGLVFRGFSVVHSNATAPSHAFYSSTSSASSGAWLDDIVFSNQKASGSVVESTNTGNSVFITITGCLFDNSDTGTGRGITVNNSGSHVYGCYIRSRSARGISIADGVIILQNCVIDRCGTYGVYLDTASSNCGVQLHNCTIYGCTSSGIYYTGATVSARPNKFTSCIFSGNGGYGINFSASTPAARLLGATEQVIILNCCFYNNTSGATNPTITTDLGRQTLDPQFVNAAAGNFTVTNESLKATGYPTAIGSVPNYVTPGALQVQSPTPAEIAEAVWEYPDRQLTA